MKKIITSLLIALLFVLPLFYFSGCGKTVTPVAAVQFKAENEQVVIYTAYSNPSDPHIYVFDIASDIPTYNNEQPADYRLACENSSAIYISFKRNLGKDTLNGTEFLYCDIDRWQSMDITLRKESGTYGDAKDFYLNGKKLVVGQNKNDSKTETDGYVFYHFENFGLKRSNPNGQMNGTINVIEYK